MLPRSQELLNMHSSGCICAYAVSPATAVRMGNSVVPSVASRENKAVRTVWKLGGQHRSTAGNGSNLSMLTQAQKPNPRALSIPAGGFWASINMSDLFTAQINWSSELLKLKSCTRKACCWILNRTICNKPYPQFLSKAKHLQATPGCWKEACHFILSLCIKKVHPYASFMTALQKKTALKPQDVKCSYIPKGRAPQSILPPPFRKDLPEMPSKADTCSSINYRNYNRQSPK